MMYPMEPSKETMSFVGCLHKEDLNLHNVPLFINRVAVEFPYDPNNALAHLHMHDFVEMSIVVAGKGIHQTLLQTTECHAGDVFIINEGVPHAYCATSDGECPTVCNVIFDPKDILDSEYSDSESPDYCYGVFRDNGMFAYVMLTDKTLGNVNNTLLVLEKELNRKKYAWKQAVKAYLINLLIMASRYAEQSDVAKGKKSLRDTVIVQYIMRSVLDHYDDPELRLDKIAHSLFVSKSSAGQIFKKISGMNFLDYIRCVRMEKACLLLSETEMTNEQIVSACGLRDVPTFYRNFKEYTGMTPSEYRQKMYAADMNTSKNAPSKSPLGEQTAEYSVLEGISQHLLAGNVELVTELVQRALDEGIAPDVILNQGMVSGMDIIGERFKNGEIYIPEVLVASRAMNRGIAILKPYLVSARIKACGKVRIGTVQGDLHDIGKNLVKMMLEGKGLEVVDLGTDVSPEAFIQTAIEQNCRVICCSALLTTTMGVMEDVVRKAVELGVRDKIKIMIGGAPVNEEYCARIGADLYTPDAATAAEAAVKFCQE